jgi:L-fuconolactonase
MGWPRVAEGEWEPWASHFARAAEHPGCTVKFSGMDMSIGEVDVDRFRRYADHALEHFGPERMLWGSNWPVSLMLRGYAELLEAARSLTAQCSRAQRDAILGGTANRVYRLGLDAG